MALFYPHEFDESIAPGTSLAQVFRQDFASADHVPPFTKVFRVPWMSTVLFVFGELTSNKLYFGQQKWWFNEQQIVC